MLNGHSIVFNNTICVYNKLGLSFANVNASQIENTISSNNRNIGIFLVENKNINIKNISISHNVDSGLSIVFSMNIYIDDITINDNGIYLVQTKWIYISGFTAVNEYSISNYAQFIAIDDSQTITIYDTVVNVNMSVVSSGELSSQPAVIYLYNSTLNLRRCTFMGNRITGVKAIASNITLSGNLIFSNNSAYTGSAFILIDNSILILTETCQVHFMNNHASNTGGVFSISNTQTFKNNPDCFPISDPNFCNVSVIPTSTCFLRTQIGNSSTNFFNFIIQLEREGRDIVYGGYVAHGLNNNKNCMDTFKQISNISEASLSLVSSDPL